MTRLTPRLASAVCAAVLAGVLTSCGLPDEQRSQVVDDSTVPYDLLAPDTPSDGHLDPGAAVPKETPVVFWLSRDDRLTPTDAGLTCADSPTAVVGDVLANLIAAPGAAERAAGLSSALPSTARLSLVRVADGVAEVDLDPVTIADAEQLPLAVGQIVLSVTSAPGVDAVRLATSDEPVDLPLPSGALATRDVSAEDYAALLPERLHGGDGLRSIGCADPPT
ncbi:MAG TPA: GerMN domain-containing protein [Nocardioides sp.]